MESNPYKDAPVYSLFNIFCKCVEFKKKKEYMAFVVSLSTNAAPEVTLCNG
jgi:hypothetical protein